jgi:hydrogenase expression/formation protein HypD
VKYTDEFRNPFIAHRLIGEIQQLAQTPVTIIEFCGGHTHAIMRYGLRTALAPAVRLLSGPGCPVCVTSDTDIDAAIDLARRPEVILATFGDMLRVPGSRGSLQQARAAGAHVQMVYSALDALELARQQSNQIVVMLGVGFETTAPTVAAAIDQAQQEKLTNFTVFSLHKLTPPPMRAILASEVHVDAVLGPGHVSAIIGWQAWEFMPCEFGVSCATAGFEPVDILQAIHSLVQSVQQKNPRVINDYRRGVTAEGNLVAQALMDKVFTVSQADWRGLGSIAASGLEISPAYAQFNARIRFEIQPYLGPTPHDTGCRCGDVLRAVIEPPQCPLFARACTPEHPLGPCMVSAEGSCAAFFRYGRESV